MATTNKFTVPTADRADFRRLVQRANRRINANLRFIQQEDIRSTTAQRALVGDYGDPTAWSSPKTVFSRSIKFENEKQYQQYRRHLEEWAGKEGAATPDRDPEARKEGYYRAIIKALTTTAIENGESILTKSGRLPARLAQEIKSMTLDQITHFFEGGDPSDDIQALAWDSYTYIGVDRDDFVQITKAHINKVKSLYPAAGEQKATARKSKSKSKSKKRKKRKSRKKKNRP